MARRYVDAHIRHPDGSTWFVAGLFMLRDGRIERETWYSAPRLEAPAWRAQWVDRFGPRERTHGR